jgi:outer membrane lipoprotein-sorting protein
MKAIILMGFTGVLSMISWQTPTVPSALKGHHAALQAAGTLRLSYTAQKLSGGSEKMTAVFAKPNRFRIDSMSKTWISDGKNLWTINKASKTYTEEPASLARTKDTDLWAWNAFFDTDAFKGSTEVVVKGNRALRGTVVSEISGKVGKDAVTMYLDPKLGILRGLGNADSIIFATEAVLEKDPAADKEFAFAAPLGYTKEEPKPADAVAYAEVDAIFKRACLSCHNSGNAKGGYSVQDYNSAVKEVKPGDPAGSVMVQYIKGIRTPRMPKGGSLSNADIETIEKWVKAGAKNE